MTSESNIRIDKYLWAVRLFKTRSSASEACRKGRVLIGGVPVKPSRTITMGDIISVKKMPAIFTYQVISAIEKRVSAKFVSNHIADITPEEEKARLLLARQPASFGYREKGAGRPTKKERRIIDNMLDNPNGM
ncbi:MAG: S4 domain-containing protein [Bacteroidales bacterium]